MIFETSELETYNADGFGTMLWISAFSILNSLLGDQPSRQDTLPAVPALPAESTSYQSLRDDRNQCPGPIQGGFHAQFHILSYEQRSTEYIFTARRPEQMAFLPNREGKRPVHPGYASRTKASRPA